MQALLDDPSLRLYLLGALIVMMVGCLIISAAVLRRLGRLGRQRARVDQALAVRAPQAVPTLSRNARGRAAAMAESAGAAGLKLSQGKWGDSLLAQEDRRLVERCFLQRSGRAKGLFILARLTLALSLPLAVLWLLEAPLARYGWAGRISVAFLGFALGWMLPKWVLMRHWSARRKQAAQEISLLIDLLRLLQGVGLSVDQSIHVLVSDFSGAMPVLGEELRHAAELYQRGRSREQSLARLSLDYENDDLTAICRLIVQIDKHGGAVQDPLLRFSERVRERRKLDLKAHVARLAVKMTAVMVLTLLPALLIVTGGSGFVAVIRSLSRVTGG